MLADEPAWVVDAADAARLAVLEDELARLYERLRARAPDDDTAMVLERLASSARTRAQVFGRLAAEGGGHAPLQGDAAVLLAQWLEAQCRFEAAATEAAGHGDEGLDDFRDAVAHASRCVDAVLLVAGRDLDAGSEADG